MDLKSKVVMITGAGGPMGKAIAKRFYEEDAKLVLTDISENRLLQTIDMLTDENGSNKNIFYLRSDVLNKKEIKEVVNKAIGIYKKIDILVNIVGGIRAKKMDQPILEMENERWDQTMDLNLKGGINCIKLIAPQMIESESGKIINISSINFAGEPGYADYGAAKAAVASFTKTAAMELGPYINVNCIAPAVIQTSVLDRMDKETLDYYRDRTLLKRLGKPEDVANTALFLASNQSDYITGEIIAVSGGVSPHL
ncbi:SDR family NAD(P)-dependent oxidoreductase [Lentibacillus sp. CBA3610]|uniref:SDR family NAD(P)-dependent oxidoreductase n=1 Tax=Lentibacillus sp. CBA3610 TaxID=2518176 RepID=UPI001594F22E|nr:SDR family NAD(P)-dependent oxidoreductase [Lentibacillus sp. CBA3610]QKY69632.1 SDR family oxidoreductase [Lentibacillus sp. CBA3610]